MMRDKNMRLINDALSGTNSTFVWGIVISSIFIYYILNPSGALRSETKNATTLRNAIIDRSLYKINLIDHEISCTSLK